MKKQPSPAGFYMQRGLNVESYDKSTVEFGRIFPDLPFFLDQAGQTGGAVLELGCGTGRIVWALARAGYDVTGLDISHAMLEQAGRKGASAEDAVRARVRWVRQSMESFDLGFSYALIYSTFRSFMALTGPETQRSCLESCRRHLRPGGRLILNLFDPRLDLCLPGYRSAPSGGGPWRLPGTGNLVIPEIIEHFNDPVRQVLREVWQFTEVTDAGDIVRSEREALEMRWTYRYEMRYLLELCGFEIIAEYSDFTGSPPAYGREQVWVAGAPS